MKICRKQKLIAETQSTKDTKGGKNKRNENLFISKKKKKLEKKGNEEKLREFH